MENYVRIQLNVKADPGRIFQALTDSHALTKWFSEFADVVPAAKAYDFWGRFTPEAPATQQAGHHPLTQLTPDRHLGFSWQLNQTDTHVLFKLLKGQDETLLTLRHAGPEGAQLTDGWSLEDFWFLSLENLRRHVDGRSAAARVDFTKAMVGDIHHEIEVDAPAAKVFEVLIRPDQMNRWIANDATVEPEPGGLYSFGWIGMKILEIVPDKKLTVSSKDEGSGQEMIVTWSLAENDGKTRLTFVHSGFAPDQSSADVHIGWLAFTNAVGSIAEYGADWKPPIVLIKPETIPFYSTAIGNAQGELVDELRAPSDPLIPLIA